MIKGLSPDPPTFSSFGCTMGCGSSKHVPKPALPRSISRAVKRESPDAGSVNSESEVQATVESGVQATAESGVQATAASGGLATVESGMQATDILNVKNLSSELTTITNWYQLGLYLNLQTHELNKIQQDHAHHGNDRQMLEMLALWLRRTPNPTWDDVVSTLQQMRENRVAENIHQKHLRRTSK